MRKQAGVTLLEMIIVLALMGISLVWYTRYQSRKADEYARQNVVNALAHEMKGVINLAQESVVPVEGNKDTREANPLYNPKANSAYHQRIVHLSENDDSLADGEYYVWGEGNTQERYYFINNKCKNTRVFAEGMAFSKEYLPCKMVKQALNTELQIDRIAFTNSGNAGEKLTINTVEVTVGYNMSGNDAVQIANYAPQFASAYQNVKLSYSHAYVVYRNRTAGAGSPWKIAKDSNNRIIDFSHVSNNIAGLQNLAKQNRLGIRFVFDLNDNSGSPVLPDGSVAVDKLCWNPAEGKAQVCYQQLPGTGTHGEDQVMALTVKDPELNNGRAMTGTILTNVVLENTARPVYLFARTGGVYGGQPYGDVVLDADNKPSLLTMTDPDGVQYTAERTGTEKFDYDWYDAFELVTPPYIDQVATNNQRDDAMESRASLTPKITETGAVTYLVHTCPKVTQSIVLKDRNGEAVIDDDTETLQEVKVERQLYPRISVALSSIAGDQLTSGSGKRSQFISFSDLSKNREVLSDANSVVENLAGVAIQANFVKSTAVDNHYQRYVWLISSMVASYNADTGKGKNMINPTSASYVVTRWCSTLPQNDMPAGYVNDLAKEKGEEGYLYKQ